PQNVTNVSWVRIPPSPRNKTPPVTGGARLSRSFDYAPSALCFRMTSLGLYRRGDELGSVVVRVPNADRLVRHVDRREHRQIVAADPNTFRVGAAFIFEQIAAYGCAVDFAATERRNRVEFVE